MLVSFLIILLYFTELLKDLSFFVVFSDFFCFNILIGVLGLAIGRFEQVYSADDIIK